eukprot:scaffold8136_cov127-Cylindrotheca_fusiformis.AAC.2
MKYITSITLVSLLSVDAFSSVHLSRTNNHGGVFSSSVAPVDAVYTSRNANLVARRMSVEDTKDAAKKTAEEAKQDVKDAGKKIESKTEEAGDKIETKTKDFESEALRKTSEIGEDAKDRADDLEAQVREARGEETLTDKAKKLKDKAVEKVKAGGSKAKDVAVAAKDKVKSAGNKVVDKASDLFDGSDESDKSD